MNKYLLTLGAALLAFGAAAVPAKRIVKDVTLADGSVVRATLMGDEHCRFYLTAEGAVLMPDDRDELFFACQGPDGRLMRSSEVASKAAPASARLSALQPAITRSVELRAPERSARIKAAAAAGTANESKGVGLYASSYIHGIGSPRALVILVEYKDVKFTTSNAGEYFNNLVNQPGFNKNGATGSVMDYFTEASMGQFTPKFDVLGPVTLPQNQSYYGGNDAWGNDKNPTDMVRHAAAALDATVDFSVYDNDGDGVVDNVYIIYAGKGEASGGAANTVWPHSFDLSQEGGVYKVDGVYMDHYACSNEIEGSKPDGIGTFVHEFSHVLGLPDLYTTDYGSAANLTPGAYSVLDYGPYNNNGNTPPSYSIFERNAMGWMDCEVLDSPRDLELEHIMTSNKGYIIPTGNKNEFFLLENRQQAGWDKYIPGHGMLIWHIDYKASPWMSNSVNNTASHQYVDIEEAGGTANSTNATTMASYPFPGTKNKTAFTSSTTPALKTWAGKAIDMPITEITEKGGVITALAAGGNPGPSLDIPAVAPVTGVSAHGFTASWAPVEGATDYRITVYAYHVGEPVDLPKVGFDGSTLPEGWTAEKSDWYRTSKYIGESAPSFRFAANGRYLQTAKFDGAVSSLSFWAITTPSSPSKPYSTLTILNGDAESGTEICTVDNLTDTGSRIDVEADFSGATQLTFVGNVTNGYIGLDDINISIRGEKQELVSAYDGLPTGGQCSIAVTGLPDADKYAFSVVALNDEMQSKPSPLVFVAAPSGIFDITTDDADAPVEYYNLQGMRILRPAQGQIVIVKQGNRVKKAVF